MAGYDPAEGDFDLPASDGVTDDINNSSNVPRAISQSLASTLIETLLEKKWEAAGKADAGLGGALVQPAVWLAGRKMPQPGDIALWTGSMAISPLGGLGGSLATGTLGVMKAAA